MLAPTHSVFGLFLTLIILAAFGIKSSLHWTIMVIAIIGAIIPDIDHPKSLIGKLFSFISVRLERKFGHRTFTHSFLGAFTFTIILAFLILAYNLILYGISVSQNIQHPHFTGFGLGIRWIAAFFISYMSHLILDMFNKQGSQLFWPNMGRDVIPKNIRYRLESGSKYEILIFIILLILVIFAFPISKYGFGSSLRWVIATPESAIAEYKNLKNHTFIEFSGVYSATHEKVEGNAEILDVSNKQLVVLYNQKVFLLSSENGADIISSKVRVKYSEVPLIYKQVVFKDQKREDLLSQITKNSLVIGYVQLPTDMQIKFPAEDIKQVNFKSMYQEANRLILNYANKQQLQKLGLDEQFVLLQKQSKVELNSLKSLKTKTLHSINVLRNQDDGYTAKGRALYGDPEKIAQRDAKIEDLKNQLAEIDIKIEAKKMLVKEHDFLFSGEVKVRE